jgi:hypothetical protein
LHPVQEAPRGFIELTDLAGCNIGVARRTMDKLKCNLALAGAPRSGRPKSLAVKASTRAVQIGVDSIV